VFTKQNILEPATRKGENDSPTESAQSLESALDAVLRRCVRDLEKESFDRQVLTSVAIDAAEPRDKRSALQSGLGEWKKILCTNADRYYNASITGYLKSPLRGEHPAYSAYRQTAHALSWFLRVNTLDRGEEGRTGYVREFIFRVVTSPDHPDALRLAFRANEWIDSALEFQLPAWAAPTNPSLGELIGTPMGKRATRRPFLSLSSLLTVDQTDHIVRTAEAHVLATIVETLNGARDIAMINTGANHPYPSQTKQAGKPRGRHGGRTKSKVVEIRNEVIQKVVAKTRGRPRAYCAEMDRLNWGTDLEWQKKYDCPRSYSDAWNHPDHEKRRHFHDLISNEKHRALRPSKTCK